MENEDRLMTQEEVEMNEVFSQFHEDFSEFLDDFLPPMIHSEWGADFMLAVLYEIDPELVAHLVHAFGEMTQKKEEETSDESLN